MTQSNTISAKPGRIALISLVEAICVATTRTLQIEAGELSGNWSPVLGGGDHQANIFFYDLLPGGAGYTRMLKDNLDEVFLEAEKILSECTCDVSCYHCLRHYENNFFHHSLDRHLALSLLKYVRYGISPKLDDDAIQTALEPLVELLRLKGIATEKNITIENTHIPLLIKIQNSKAIWLDVHHPFIDYRKINVRKQQSALAKKAKYLSVDAFSLQHDLPAVFSQIV